MSKAKIVGRILGQNGHPLADAAVMIAAGPAHNDIASLTDDEGRYVIDGLEPGSYAVKATAAAFEAATQRVQLTHADVTVDFKLRRQ